VNDRLLRRLCWAKEVRTDTIDNEMEALPRFCENEIRGVAVYVALLYHPEPRSWPKKTREAVRNFLRMVRAWVGMVVGR